LNYDLQRCRALRARRGEFKSDPSFTPIVNWCTLRVMTPLLVIAGIALAAYLISLLLHPWRVCGSCKGQGRHKGALFTYATRSCTSCGGNGRRARLGVMMFHGGRQVWGERAPGVASAKRSKNFGR
jgi:hypothetical protein